MARNQTLRTLDLLEALCGHAASGATNGELAQAVKTTPADITRCMAQLTAKGWARKNPENGRFYPQPAIGRLVYRIDADFGRAQQQLEDRRRAMTGA